MTNETVPHVRFGTDDLPEAARFPAFRQAVGASHDVERLEGDTRIFHSTMDLWMLGNAALVSGWQPGLVYLRPAHKIETDRIESYSFLLLRDGSWTGEAGAHALSAGPGQVVAFDRAIPMRAVTTDNTSVVLTLARSLLQKVTPEAPDLHGRLFEGGSGRLFADHLFSLVRELPSLKASDIPHALSATVALAAACLSGLPALEAHGTDIRHLAMQHINRELLRGRLSPGRIAADLGVSRSVLYRAFQRYGGVQAYIRARRLEAIHGLLGEATEDRSISELGYDFGFASSAHFSTAFRERFGFTPSEIRRQRTPGASKPLTDATVAYRTWTQRVGGVFDDADSRDRGGAARRRASPHRASQ